MEIPPGGSRRTVYSHLLVDTRQQRLMSLRALIFPSVVAFLLIPLIKSEGTYIYLPMNWHSKPTAAIVMWMDLRPSKGLQPGLPALQPDECAEHKVCSKPSKRTICENAILAQVWLRPGVPRPFDLHSSKRVLNKLHFTLLYSGYGLWHQSAATVSSLPGAREQWELAAWLSARHPGPACWEVLQPLRLGVNRRARLWGFLGLPNK